LSSNIQVAALSDVGCVRTNNEDNFGYDPVADLYVVCDGMGGMAAGEVASAIACSTVITTFASQPEDTPIEVRLSLSIRAANDAVVHSGQLAEHKGMGTTLVCAAFTGSKLLIGNVGDSRCYLFQNGACMQVTLDHSYVNELVRAGTIKIEDIPNLDLDQFASVITRAIGAAREIEPDFFFIDLHPGDAILLASDGLTRYVEGASIAELVDPSNLQGSCQQLIDKAKAAGGADNITCILLRYDAPAEVQPEVQTQAPLETPAEAQPQTPAETEIEVPVAAVETPVAAPEAPAETHTEPPTEAPIDTAADESTAEPEAPVEAHPDEPAVVKADAPAETQTDAPTEAKTDTPAEAPTSISFDELLNAASETKPDVPSDDPLDALFGAPPEAGPTAPEAPSPPVSHEHQV